MTTSVALFRKQLLDTLPDDPIVATIIPKQDRYWHQNPAKSVLKFPAAVAVVKSFFFLLGKALNH